ncbi:response regulator transcription factor [Candidatus Sumerlaeota bacterium]|nr:response regulator transcription factor [Candidatus Sumerlaeota bacterium]
MRILLIEDSKRLRRSITIGLKQAGYKVDATGDGEEGLWYAESYNYDVIILDLMLPGMDGLNILRRLREQGRNLHVLILSAKDTVEDRVRGLRAGADDYLIKPFAFEELLARVQALVRRRYGVKNNLITIGELQVDVAKREVSRNGQIIDLPPREYALLEFLVMRRGSVVTRSEIEEHLYDENVELMSNVVDAAICSLRKKIDKPGKPSLIKTRRGMGYIIE